jgi:signal transduction histidine kinase
MLHEFLINNQEDILVMTAKKTLEFTGAHPSSEQLKKGLPIFYTQLLNMLKIERAFSINPPLDNAGFQKAGQENDEPAIAAASGHPEEAGVTESAGQHGAELQRLDYTLSHVVHAYGAMCQSITEIASEKKITITPHEFHDLNRSLDIAIAGAVTKFQSQENMQTKRREVEHLGFLAHELRNALNTASFCYQLIKGGSVGVSGKTGQLMENSLNQMEELIDRSLTEVRLRVDPTVHIESGSLLQLVNQLGVIAEIKTQSRNQLLEIQIDPALVYQTDRHLLYSILSNLIQNAIKYTHVGGKIQIRAAVVAENLVVEVEDECGGLLTDTIADLFKPFVQQHENREGLGLGLAITQRAIALLKGTLDARNLPGKGCIFTITLPKSPSQ